MDTQKKKKEIEVAKAINEQLVLMAHE